MCSMTWTDFGDCKISISRLVLVLARRQDVESDDIWTGLCCVYQRPLALVERTVLGLVKPAILVGVPVLSDESCWRGIRAVVAGRIVNVFSSETCTLGFLYRTSSFQSGVAGLQAVGGVEHVEKVNVTKLTG